MFDVGDLPVLTFFNCVLKAGVIKWPVNLHVRCVALRCVAFFSKSKNMTFYVFIYVIGRPSVCRLSVCNVRGTYSGD